MFLYVAFVRLCFPLFVWVRFPSPALEKSSAIGWAFFVVISAERTGYGPCFS